MDIANGIIARDELRERLDSDTAISVVDVLSEDAYRESHIPGSINIPAASLRERAPDRLPNRQAEVVVYCASPSCTASDGAADALRSMGYEHVFDYRGGKEHWREGGLSLESGAESTVAAS